MSVSKILTFILPTKAWHKKNAAVLHFSECRVSMCDVLCRLPDRFRCLSDLSLVAPMSARAVPGQSLLAALFVAAALLHVIVFHATLCTLHLGLELANTESH